MNILLNDWNGGRAPTENVCFKWNPLSQQPFRISFICANCKDANVRALIHAHVFLYVVYACKWQLLFGSYLANVNDRLPGLHTCMHAQVKKKKTIDRKCRGPLFRFTQNRTWTTIDIWSLIQKRLRTCVCVCPKIHRRHLKPINTMADETAKPRADIITIALHIYLVLVVVSFCFVFHSSFASMLSSYLLFVKIRSICLPADEWHIQIIVTWLKPVRMLRPKRMNPRNAAHFKIAIMWEICRVECCLVSLSFL